MTQVFTLDGAVRRNPEVTRWIDAAAGDLKVMAKHWLEVMRGCGDDVRDLMHDGQATACVAGVAFAYVSVHKAHVNVGFFNGATLPDPARLLEGTGRFMRHVKLTAAAESDDAALVELIQAAYAGARAASA